MCGFPGVGGRPESTIPMRCGKHSLIKRRKPAMEEQGRCKDGPAHPPGRRRGCSRCKGPAVVRVSWGINVLTHELFRIAHPAAQSRACPLTRSKSALCYISWFIKRRVSCFSWKCSSSEFKDMWLRLMMRLAYGLTYCHKLHRIYTVPWMSPWGVLGLSLISTSPWNERLL